MLQIIQSFPKHGMSPVKHYFGNFWKSEFWPQKDLNFLHVWIHAKRINYLPYILSKKETEMIHRNTSPSQLSEARPINMLIESKFWSSCMQSADCVWLHIAICHMHHLWHPFTGEWTAQAWRIHGQFSDLPFMAWFLLLDPA